MEAGAEHPGAGTLTDRAPGTIIGVDLGTTNSAVAWAPAERGAIRIFDVPQLVAAGETAAHPMLPSFLYLPTAAERDGGTVRLPWNAAPDIVAGTYARDEGATAPARQIASAKSWLSNARVDRTAAILPWGIDEGRKLSPVDASAEILRHLRHAWNHRTAEEPAHGTFEAQDIVLTVPASFDEEARELTVQAARDAGLDRFTLLEEPLAALYAWMAAHRHAMAALLAEISPQPLLLVCDVGGGTTDFTLVRARPDDAGELALERIAIGEHLLLGGDNLDLALAVLVEGRLGGAARLSLMQRQILRRKCSAAKEVLLEGDAADRVPITILGSGRGVIGGGVATELTRQDTREALERFLPLNAPDDLPPRDRRVALRELGLPYESEPAITRHLAAFLARSAPAAGATGMARPDAVLFNGGFFTPAIARERVLEAMAGWFGRAPAVLETGRPEAAVAIGAAFYGQLRRNPAAARRLLIRAGSARSYYIGLETPRAEAPRAVCVLPRGTAEGTRLALEREFTVTTNTPAAFTLFSSSVRTDAPGAIVTLDAGTAAERHAPLVTSLRFGKRSRRVPLSVRLETAFTETGTLEIWCASSSTEHRWRLSFNLRGIERDPLEEPVEEDPSPAAEASVVVADEAVQQAERLVQSTFGDGLPLRAPDTLAADLENELGHGRLAWPLVTIRRLADALLACEAGRRRSAAHEARWLNLAGFCTRPGFGAALDQWRVGELRKVYAAGLAFPREIQNQVEWLILWQRTSAGFTAGQQRELAQRVSGQVGLGARKPPRINPQVERESWRLLASLERLDVSSRTRIGEELLERLRREPRNTTWSWAIGRTGARAPLYGPLNAVVPPAVAEQWIERLLALKTITADTAAAIVQIGARSGDPARDITDDTARSAAERLEGAMPGIDVRPLREVVPASASSTERVFGESLPEGLRLTPAQQ